MTSKRYLSSRIWRGIICAAYLLTLSMLTACERAEKALEGHKTFAIWPGTAPGSENWMVDQQSGFRSITNVTKPTLTLFEADPLLATGDAMVVCPGGGFQGLSIIEEGVLVAEWLAARGVTAFVLKYRVLHEPDIPLAEEGEDFSTRAQALEPLRKIAAADGIQAMRYLRANAKEMNIDVNRIGMMGFSAGAMTAMSVVMESDVADMPNIVASIYGAMPGGTPPDNGPPLFIVHARDDPLIPVEKSLEMQSKWKDAGLPVALHVYEKGGHGFGAVKRDQPSDAWMDHFEYWLMDQGWISAN